MRIRMQHPSEANCPKCTECTDGYMYRGKKQWFCVKQIPFPQEDGTRPKWSVTLPNGTKIPTWEPGCNHKTPIQETLTEVKPEEVTTPEPEEVVTTRIPLPLILMERFAYVGGGRSTLEYRDAIKAIRVGGDRFRWTPRGRRHGLPDRVWRIGADDYEEVKHHFQEEPEPEGVVTTPPSRVERWVPAPRRPLVQRPVIEAVAAPPGYGAGSPFFHPLGVITERNQRQGDLNYRVTPSGRGNFHASARGVADRITAEKRGVVKVEAHKVQWSQEGQKIVADLDGKGKFYIGTHALSHFLELAAAKRWFNSSLRGTLLSAGRRGSITVNDAVSILQDLTPSIARRDRNGEFKPIYAGVRNPTGSIADGRQWFATYTERYTPYNGDVFLKDVMREVPGDWLGHAWYDVDSTKTSFIASSPRGVDVGRKLSEGDIVGRQVRGWTDDTKGSSAWLFAALLRLVCLNGMTAPSGQGVVQVRHSVPNIREETRQGLRQALHVSGGLLDRYQVLANTVVEDPEEAFRTQVYPHLTNSVLQGLRDMAHAQLLVTDGKAKKKDVTDQILIDYAVEGMMRNLTGDEHYDPSRPVMQNQLMEAVTQWHTSRTLDPVEVAQSGGQVMRAMVLGHNGRDPLYASA